MLAIMRITVTKEDIAGGRRSDPEDCPVARALRRAGLSHFGVTGMAVMMPGESQHASVLLPARVQEWIMDFDWGTPVKPFEFELTLPEKPPRSRARKSAKSKPPVLLRPVPALDAESMLLPRLNLDRSEGGFAPDRAQATEPELAEV
jgi:hypothetical protein